MMTGVTGKRWRQRIGLGLPAIVWIAFLPALVLAAEAPRPGPMAPFPSPEDFFQRLFGGETEQDRQALEQI